MKLTTIILAAGKGTRMYSTLPKVLHQIAGKALLRHVYDMSQQLANNQISIIYGYGGQQLKDKLSDLPVAWIEQAQQLGTGHAVQQAQQQIADDAIVLILYGDVPLLKLTTVETLLANASQNTLSLLTVFLNDPSGYGRIVRNEVTGNVLKIVEEKDATTAEKLITEVNTGILAVPGAKLKKWLGQLSNQNAQGEYYLTDIIEMAVNEGIAIVTTQPSTETEVLGVNNRQQLAQLERVYQLEQATALLLRGVTLKDPTRFDLRGIINDVGQDVEIDINVILEGRIDIGNNVKVGPNCFIKNTSLADGVEILANSVIEDAIVGAGSRIGPYARLRPETVLGENTHIGNFVEIKKARIGNDSKVNHLSYIGDAAIGMGVNVGAGTITCNYDGANKFMTIIEDGAFIGSDTQLVAPVKVGKNATIGAGSTITKDAPDNQLTLSRVSQTTLEGWRRPVKKSS